jgi:Na+/H+-dicarboxylate symporter
MSKIRSMSLTTRIMIGMVLGVAVGFIFQAILAGEDDYLIPLGLFSLPIKAFFC